MSNDLGNYLRKLRGKRSLRDVAERTGLSHTYIADVENGFRRGSNKPIKPTPETLKKLSEAYGGGEYTNLMVLAGYWPEDELLEPKDKILQNDKKESPSAYTAKELSEIPIEELANHTLTYKGHVLSEDEKRQFLTILKAAEAMIEKNRGS